MTPTQVEDLLRALGELLGAVPTSGIKELGGRTMRQTVEDGDLGLLLEVIGEDVRRNAEAAVYDELPPVVEVRPSSFDDEDLKGELESRGYRVSKLKVVKDPEARI